MKSKNVLLLILILLLAIAGAYYLFMTIPFYNVLVDTLLWESIMSLLFFVVMISFSVLIFFIFIEKSIKGMFSGSVAVFSAIVAFILSNTIYFLFNDVQNHLVETLFYVQIITYFILLGMSVSYVRNLNQLNEGKKKQHLDSQMLITRIIGSTFLISALLIPALLNTTQNIYSIFLLLLLTLYTGNLIIVFINFLFAKISK